MKSVKIAIAIFSVVLVSCGTQKFYSYRLKNIQQTERGTVYLELNGLGKSEDDAYNDAAISAFNAVLFKGIPGSVQPKPLIDDETKAKNDHKQIMECFRTFSCYNKYVSYSEKVGVPYKVKDGISVSLRLKINVDLLRAYLVQNGVIRQFGL